MVFPPRCQPSGISLRRQPSPGAGPAPTLPGLFLLTCPAHPSPHCALRLCLKSPSPFAGAQDKPYEGRLEPALSAAEGRGRSPLRWRDHPLCISSLIRGRRWLFKHTSRQASSDVALQKYRVATGLSPSWPDVPTGLGTPRAETRVVSSGGHSKPALTQSRLRPDRPGPS